MIASEIQINASNENGWTANRLKGNIEKFHLLVQNLVL